jgi:hypothetical protein
MTPTLIPTAATPWYAQRWPWLLMLGPATVLAGGAYVTTLALGHPDAMVVDDYYKQGKAINQDLRREHVAASLGLSVHLRYVPAAGRLEGSIEGTGKPFTAPFALRFAHPTLPQKDIQLMVKPDDTGRFVVALPALEATHWQVVVEGALRDWKMSESWDWKKQGQVEVSADR